MRVVISEFMSLDGVVQAPGGKDEDTSGGFRHGGWSFDFFDPEVMGAVVDEYAERSEVLLQGQAHVSSLGGRVARPRWRPVLRLDQQRSEVRRVRHPLRVGSLTWVADDHHPR